MTMRPAQRCRMPPLATPPRAGRRRAPRAPQTVTSTPPTTRTAEPPEPSCQATAAGVIHRPTRRGARPLIRREGSVTRRARLSHLGDRVREELLGSIPNPPERGGLERRLLRLWPAVEIPRRHGHDRMEDR